LELFFELVVDFVSLSLFSLLDLVEARSRFSRAAFVRRSDLQKSWYVSRIPNTIELSLAFTEHSSTAFLAFGTVAISI
jgi:hypothetical protein